MKNLRHRSFYCVGLSILICTTGAVRTMGGNCAVSDGSKLPSDDGCILAFVYNQTDDHRLVVLDEKNRRRYEAPLEKAKSAPFWEGGKVYVVDTSGSLQGFSIGSDKLIAEKTETISAGVVRETEYVRSQDRLYLIRTKFDDQHKISYEISAIDFPTRKVLWTKEIDSPGPLRIIQPYVCVTGLEQVQVFNCDTGEKLGRIEAAKAAAAADSNGHK